MNALDIEIAVAKHFNWRQNIIVPNVSWGWGLRYEADMVIVSSVGYAAEVEIKVTRGDIKADHKKRHQHDSPRFRRLWFAVPKSLADDPAIPSRAGILAVDDNKYGKWVETVRGGTLNRNAEKLSEAHIRRLLELGVMRVWSLKEHVRNKYKSTPSPA